MTAAVATKEDFEQLLIEDIAAFQHDPVGFVYYVFPWGEPNTELSDKTGPREWQIEVLEDIAIRLRQGADFATAVRESVASGHGIGKSALVSWIILWGLSTFEDAKGVVTANTETQLKTKTWAEVAKWHRLAINEHWFKYTATALFSSDPKHEKTWRIDMVPWSERNTEAFAGLHNEGKRVLLIFDEASAIPDLIWEVAEGALTDENTEIIWCAFGNPTRSKGRFRECFSKFRKRWNCQQIDSRSVDGTNKAQFAEWAEDYDEDSDFFRVRVRGLFPRVDDTALFAEALIDAAMERVLTPPSFAHYPKILSIDVARMGADRSVLTLRQGPKVHWQKKFAGLKTMELAGKARDLATREGDVQAIPVDGPGVGGGVVDVLEKWGMPVVEFQPASTSPAPDKYINLRAWCFEQCAMWLENADLPAGDKQLREQLQCVTYGYNDHMKLQIQKSKDIQEEIGYSPDEMASLIVSFCPVDHVVRPAIDQLMAARSRGKARRKNWGAHS